MSQHEHINESGEWTSPTIEACGLTFHYMNTLLRMFGDQWKDLNHVEWRDENGKLHGIRVTQELFDALFENDYPFKFDPHPDDQTIDWFVRLETLSLEDELSAL